MPLFHHKETEQDVPLDTSVAASRDPGGVPDPSQPDQNSTTGTTPSGSFVGRIAGDDIGAFEESGAERRAEATRSAAESEADADADADAQTESALASESEAADR